MHRSRQLAWQLSVFCAFVGVACAAGNEEQASESFEADQAYVKAHYTKHEFRIEMRDGIRLFTAVFCPKDESSPCPILLKRTPYGLRPYGADNYPESPDGPLKYYADQKFIFAYQDVRGRNASEGTFEHVRPHNPRKAGLDIDESTDTYDTIEWLVKNIPNNNGNVGLTGISYPGFYAAAGMIDAHPALKCVSPQAPVTDWFLGDDFRHNGAFYLPHAFRFLTYFGHPLDKPTRQKPPEFDYETPDGYEFYLNFGRLVDARQNHFPTDIEYWDEIIQHDTYDSFWQARTILPHVKRIKPAVMTVGGWFDAEDCYGALHLYTATERLSPGGNNTIVMGPWSHGGWHRTPGDHLGSVAFNQDTSAYFRREMELPFLRHFLQGGEDPKLPEAFMFETGTNQWRRHDVWPPANAATRSLYLHANGRLAFEPPDDNSGYDEYISDPAKPVPFVSDIAPGMTQEHMVDDQRFAARRPDVLVYATEPLSEDVTIAGPISPSLYVSTSGTDSDFIVKLIDVYHGDFPDPDPNPRGARMGGYQQLVRGEAFRGRFRHSFAVPEPFVPDEISEIEYNMPDANHTFRRGHRIMIHIQSTWFPLIDRNPQKFVDIKSAGPDDYQKATQRVYRAKDHLSRVDVRVIGPGD